LSISITAMGTLPVGVARGRGGAQPGDWICVTGTLGDAAAGLALWRNAGRPEGMAEDDAAFLEARLRRPQPRVAAGLALLGLAHAAIDLSDGLAGDLQHILDASRVGADVDIERLPASPALGRFAAGVARWRLQVCGGDDYELCLCLPPAAFEAACRALAPLPLTRIGEITALPGLRWRDGAGHEQPLPDSAYRHFA
jgi:thiamine-monophosphate kinase